PEIENTFKSIKYANINKLRITTLPRIRYTKWKRDSNKIHKHFSLWLACYKFASELVLATLRGAFCTARRTSRAGARLRERYPGQDWISGRVDVSFGA